MSDSMTVALRVRPLVKSEVERGCRIAVQRTADGVPQVTVNQSDSFTYNFVFDSRDTQQDIYEACVRSKLKKLLQGYNVTILAYGQTGSGKTYTMGTAFDGVMDENAGVIPRAVQEIFQEAAGMEKEFHFKITCSFVELYQEQFFDLFSSNKREASTVDIREDKNRIVMPGLTEVEVTEAKHVIDQLLRGSAGRAVASTAMNETSSRSHAIFTLTVIATTKNEKKSVTTSKFNLVDLAGSERCSKTLACGDRFKEGVNINKGLLALGNVINVLGSGQTAGYIPYRQSKLTRLLQDSLGGNSITLMIACVSPADYNVNETLSTLRYADRALQIKNKPVVNVDPHAAEVMMLKEIIQKLRMEVLARGGNANGLGIAAINGTTTTLPQTNGPSNEQVQQLLEKNRSLQQELHQALIDSAENEMRFHIVEVQHEKLKAHLVELKSKLAAQAATAASVVKSEDQVEKTECDEKWNQQVQDLTQMVALVEEDLMQTENALQCRGSVADDSSSACDETYELLQSRTEEHTMKQLKLNGELRQINRQLNLKQELHERVTCNFSKFGEENSDDRYKQCELKIQQLESERTDLLELLRTSKQKDASAKIAEERRKRLNILEQELADLKRKIQQQASMLKMREKEREKIQNLSSEIRAMKESKVKLIRAMRGESERFRQWKLMREKEVTQLKSKDRKMQSEMARQETLHAKQRLVLKRKCEDAMAANKRLKDALERQRVAQAQRQRYAKDQSGPAKLDALVDREVEVILSLIDAEHSLEQLMEDRAVINAHCNEIKQQHPEPSEEQAKLLASLEEELEMRNAQIADLQQKMCSNDLDSRMRALSESVQSIGESRVINKQLLKTLIQQRREQAHGVMEQKMQLDEQRSQLNEALQQREQMMRELQQAKCKYEEFMVDQQRAFEEKVALLLHGGENDKSFKALDKTRTLPIEVASKKLKKPTPESSPDMEDENIIIDSAESDIEDTLGVDPDWKPSPRKTRKRRNTSSNSTLLELSDSKPNLSGTSNHNNSETQSSMEMTTTNRCKCLTKCDTKRCACFTLNNTCTTQCRCKGKCYNPQNIGNRDDKENSSLKINEIDKENSLEHSPEDYIKVVKTETQPLGTPNFKVPRHSRLDFNTPSSKEKFF